MRVVVTSLVLLGVPFVAHAYIGPGLGVGTIAIAFGFIASIFLALFALLYYPIKRLLAKKANKSEDEEDEMDKSEEREIDN